MANLIDLDSLKAYFDHVAFAQPLEKSLRLRTRAAKNDDLSGSEPVGSFIDNVRTESFEMREVMMTAYLYNRFRLFINMFDIETAAVRTKREMLVLCIMIALYGNESADHPFEIFKQKNKYSRKTIRR